MTMAAKKSHRKLGRALKEARAEHKQLLKRALKAHAKFEKRAHKLVDLENQIAELEQRYRQPQAAPDLRPVRLIYNAHSGDKENGTGQLDKIVETLQTHGLKAQIDLKAPGQHARDLAKEAALAGEELVIVAGGDDTVEEVAHELIGTKTALAILPVGTTNNLAHALGIPTNVEQACELIGLGLVRKIDAGEVRAGKKGTSEYLLQSAGIGLSEVAQDGHDRDQGTGASLPQALCKVELEPGRVELELASGKVISPHTQVVTVSNAPLMAENSLITPGARMDDGLLDVAIYDGMSREEVLDYFRAAAVEAHGQDPRIRFYKVRRVRVESKNSGSDSNGTTDQHQLEIRVVPQALAMIVGKGRALSFPVEALPIEAAAPEPEVSTAPQSPR